MDNLINVTALKRNLKNVPNGQKLWDFVNGKKAAVNQEQKREIIDTLKIGVNDLIAQLEAIKLT